MNQLSENSRSGCGLAGLKKLAVQANAMLSGKMPLARTLI